MAAAFAFVGMLLLSMVVALLAAFQLGDYFGATDEFVVVIVVLASFATVTIVVFAVSDAVAKSAQALNWVALTLALTALAPVFSPRLVERIAERSTNPFTAGVENTYVTLELLIPTLLTVLVQWGLVRRRWLRAAGEEDLTLWPWVATVVAGLLILNPIGLTVVAATLQRSGSDFMWQYFAMATAAVAGVLVVMASIECYIRGRIRRRRVAMGGEAVTPG
jgi:hypothetical protein